MFMKFTIGDKKITPQIGRRGFSCNKEFTKRAPRPWAIIKVSRPC